MATATDVGTCAELWWGGTVANRVLGIINKDTMMNNIWMVVSVRTNSACENVLLCHKTDKVVYICCSVPLDPPRPIAYSPDAYVLLSRPSPVLRRHSRLLGKPLSGL